MTGTHTVVLVCAVAKEDAAGEFTAARASAAPKRPPAAPSTDLSPAASAPLSMGELARHSSDADGGVAPVNPADASRSGNSDDLARYDRLPARESCHAASFNPLGISHTRRGMMPHQALLLLLPPGAVQYICLHLCCSLASDHSDSCSVAVRHPSTPPSRRPNAAQRV